MSETTTQNTDPAAAGTPPEGDQQPETFDAEYVKKLRAEAAKHRTEAKANADAAKRLAEIEEANKTEAQKAADRLAAAQRDAEQAKADALRWKIAAKFQVDDEDADLFLTGTDEETLTRQAQRLADRDAERKKSGNHVPREGTPTPSPKADEKREFLRNLTGGD